MLSQNTTLDYGVETLGTDVVRFIESAVELIENKKAIEKITLEKDTRSGLLVLSDCGLHRIPIDLLEMYWLSVLILKKNRLDKIENLDAQKELIKLELNHNQIEKIENLDHLSKVVELSLSYNKIEKLENLDGLINLSVLDCRHDKIERIENHKRNRKITVLGLSNQGTSMGYYGARTRRQFARIPLMTCIDGCPFPLVFRATNKSTLN